MKKIQPIYALFFTLILLYAFSSNPPNGYTGAPGNDNCTTCHTPNNSGFSGFVTIQGLPNAVTPNTAYNLSVVTKITGGNPNRAGFQLLILDEANQNAGVLVNADGTSAVASDEGRDYLEHKVAQDFNGIDSVEWKFEWTSPTTLPTDSIKFYLNNIIGNGSGNSGDLMVSNRPVVAFLAPPAEPVVVQIVESKDVSCFDGMDGSATVSASGGTGTITYKWSNDSTTASISNLAIGAYIVTATDAENNEGTLRVTINEPQELTIAIDSSTNIDCNNPTGTATAKASGGTAPLTYAWSTEASGATVDLVAGTHTVTVTDANQCSSTTTVTIAEDNRAPVAFAGFDVTVTCADTNTNRIPLEAFNTTTGTGVKYLWTTADGTIVSGDTTLMPIVSAAGTYILTVSNAVNGCTASDTAVVIFDIVLPTADAGTAQQLGCANNSVNLDGSGSSQGADIIYHWTTTDGNIMSGDSTVNPVVTSAGTYTLAVTNTTSGCSATATVSVTQDDSLPMVNAGTPQQLNCNANTVTLNGTASEGAGISYLWTTTDGHFVSGDSTLTPVVDSAGTYVLTVSNANNNCSAMSSVTISENFTLPMVNAGTATLDCNSTTVMLNGTGETGDNFSYVWTTSDGNIISGDSTLNAVIDAVGNYTLTATNTTNGCTAAAALTVTSNMVLPEVNAGASKQLDCTTPTVTLEGSGSTGDNFSYLWSSTDGNIMTGDSTLTPTVNGAGTYTLTITNTTTGCTASATVAVTQDANLPMADAGMSTQLGCESDTLMLTGTGSTGDNISYLWTTSDGSIAGNDSTLMVTIVGAGTYTLMVTDTANSCSVSSSVTVSSVNLPVANVGTAASLDCTTMRVMLDGSVSTGDSLLYNWTTTDGNIVEGGNTANPIVDIAGTYRLTVTNAINGCSASASVTVTGANASDLFAASGDAGQLTCKQMNLTLNANGSVGENIVYEWTTPDGNIVSGGNTLKPTIDAAGKYTLTVRDTTNGCTAVSFINIAQDIDPPTVSAGDSLTLDCATPSVTLSGSSETAFNLTYTWATNNGNIVSGANTPNPVVNAAGTYTLTVVDTFTNCSASAAVQIGQDAAVPMSNAGITQQLDCSTDTLMLTGSGSAGDNYTVNWSTENGNIIEGATTFTPTVDAVGNYILMVTDTASGCSSTSRVTVIQDLEKPMVEAGAATQVLCGEEPLIIIGTASEGDNFTYFWCTEDGNISSGAEELSVVIEGAGFFELIVTNTANGCKNADTVVVTAVERPILSLDTMSAGTATVSVSGGLAPYTYQWNTDSMDVTPTITGQLAGEYVVMVSDSNGCSDNLTVNIEVSTGVSELDKAIESLQIFPNPSADYFNLLVDFNTHQSGTVFIMNTIGQKMWEKTFEATQLNEQIDATNWAGGQYFMVIQTAEGLKTEGIMVIR